MIWVGQEILWFPSEMFVTGFNCFLVYTCIQQALPSVVWNLKTPSPPSSPQICACVCVATLAAGGSQLLSGQSTSMTWTTLMTAQTLFQLWKFKCQSRSSIKFSHTHTHGNKSHECARSSVFCIVFFAFLPLSDSKLKRLPSVFGCLLCALTPIYFAFNHNELYTKADSRCQSLNI